MLNTSPSHIIDLILVKLKLNRFIQYKKQTLDYRKDIKLDIGCGPFPFDSQHLQFLGGTTKGWILVDKYIQDPRITNWDARSLPIKNNTVSVIYSSHLLEHIPHAQVPAVVKHWHRKLKKGGQLIINVPDLEWLCKDFVKLIKEEKKQQPLRKSYYRYSVNFLKPKHSYLNAFYGNQVHQGEFHQSGFTKDSVQILLEKIGFQMISLEQKVENHEVGCLICKASKK